MIVTVRWFVLMFGLLGVTGCADAPPPKAPVPVKPKPKPMTTEQCAEDFACKAFGKCAAKAGKCVATSNDDCKRTPNCSNFGACTAKAGRCVAVEGSCTGSVCEDQGHCAVGDDGYCHATPEGCKKSAICTSIGMCSVAERKDSAPRVICRAKSDEDCQAADTCKNGGQCSAKGGTCVQ